ncbi:MAG: hypothetical protein KatS3mg110_2062 [Pirellulaceae bacterium]|nr:MAG: hypothetical protein KatS3mg110_2062 [Pirellulaceae bacterium]
MRGKRAYRDRLRTPGCPKAASLRAMATIARDEVRDSFREPNVVPPSYPKLVWLAWLAIVAACLAGCMGGGSSQSDGSATADTSADGATSIGPTTSTAPPQSATPGASVTQPAASLAEFSAVTVPPGQVVDVPITVNRAGVQGEAVVELSPAVPGLRAVTSPIPADQNQGVIQLSAVEPFADQAKQIELQVRVRLGSTVLTGRLPVTLEPLRMPEFVVPSPLVIQPGQTKTLALSVNRNGVTGLLPVSVEAPDKLTVQAVPVPDGSNETQLTVTAAADAPERQHEVKLSLTAFGKTVTASIPVQVERFAFRIRSFQAVTLKPGEQKTVRIPIDRRSHRGAIRLHVQNLPEGVTAQPVEVPAGAAQGELVLSASPQAEEQVKSVVVVGEGGGLVQTDAMVVRVSYGETGFLPREIVFDPEKAPLLRRGSFGGRLDAKSKKALLRAYGGTEESEKAVLLGLRWLLNHQMADGGWSLKFYNSGLLECDCQTQFENEVDDNDIAATALALLPMLGAGVTHRGAPEEPKELSDYCEAVEKGLTYLISKQNKDSKSTNHGYFGGGMYAHALATMAMCEAYALSRDDRLRIPAQTAVKYLADAQHDEGGWRYSRRAPGDLSVTSWVFFAIRSAQSAGLPWPRTALQKAEQFVTSCAAGPSEAPLTRYSYLPGEAPRLSMTAAGLLTRQFLGWAQDNPDLVAGCRYLAQNMPPEQGDKLGPIYYYHYATQVLHNMEGPEFDLWNHRMREHLLRTQETGGHRRGSWDPSGADHGKRGGRIYATSMALLTLEVYYRHLPYYRRVMTGTR